MKVKTLSALAGLGGAMILSGSANAALVAGPGAVTAVKFTTTTAAQTPGGARDVYRVYANFTDAADTLVTVFGDALGPFSVSLNGATAYNPASGGNTPVAASVLASYANAEWDSYVTIGLTAGQPGTEQANSGLTLSPGFPSFVTNAGIPANTNIAWTTPGPVAQGVAGAGLKVLVMQISVGAGQAAPSGLLSLVYRPAGGGTGTDVTVRNLAWAVPAPALSPSWASLASSALAVVARDVGS